MENNTERLMKLTVVIEKLYKLLSKYESYKLFSRYITVAPDVKYFSINVYVGGALFEIIHEFEKLNDVAYYTVGAARIANHLSAGK